jgi:hypothetical protein
LSLRCRVLSLGFEVFGFGGHILVLRLGVHGLVKGYRVRLYFLGFIVLGFGVWGLGFCVSGGGFCFRVRCLGFTIRSLGIRVMILVFGV